MSELYLIASHQYLQPQETNYYHDGSVVVPEYAEEEVTVVDYGREVIGDPKKKVLHYVQGLFPIAKWILHYNPTWAYSDLIAGITVGVVLVPQSMSYAQLAGLSPEFGLYSSFVGVFIYSFFATSKDVSIGPVAVMSLQVGKVIARVQASDSGASFTAPQIATFLSLICGGIAAGIGFLRLGFILEFISIPAVMGFMTGSAFSIVTGQIPGLMGYNSAVNTRDSTYKVVINTLKNLPLTTVDAAMGLVGLFILYVWKYSCDFGGKRWPKYKQIFFYVQTLRNAIVLIFSTLICWGVTHPKLVDWRNAGNDVADFKGPLKILGTVPSGLRHVGVMKIPHGIIDSMASEIPVSTIILLLEHIAIAKSFGRVNDYKINPNQELIAIGVNNLIGTFFSAYPSTGSFSRSALKNKCGVRTPLAGIWTGGVVILALYALTSTFFYIPKATLSAVIIHAVSDLMANYKTTWSFWKISPLDAGIFLIAVIITVFASIEDGIYFAISASGAVLLFRIAVPRGEFLGRVSVAEVLNPTIIAGPSGDDSSSDNDVQIHQVLSDGSQKKKEAERTKNPDFQFHTRWVPLSKRNLNAGIKVLPPPPGVVVFKPGESFTYPNCSLQVDRILDHIKTYTKRGKPYNFKDKGSRPWNDPGPLPWKKEVDQGEDTRPVLRVLHFDFSAVASIDVTSIQSLVDLRKSINTYADREVEIHFSGILSPWVRRGLLNAGFGYSEDLVSNSNFVHVADDENGIIPAISTTTPFFHLDIPDY